MADFRIWPATDGPAFAFEDDPVNLGTEFYVTQTCWLKQIHCWRGDTAMDGTVLGRVWIASGGSAGTALAGTDVTFTLSGTGWQTATLATPVQLTANVRYRASIHAPSGYTGSGNYWTSGAGSAGHTNGPLVAPSSGPGGHQSGTQGSFAYSAGYAFPNSTFQGGNYWVDVTVTDVDPNAAQTITMGLPVEEASAFPVGLAKAMTTGLPVDSDTALAMSLGKTAVLGLSAETCEPLPVVLAKAVTLGLPGETVEAFTATLGKSLTQGLPVEQDSALAVVFLELVRLGLPLEQASALALLTDDAWPPIAGVPVVRRWATGGPPTGHRWATTGPPSETAG